LSKNPHLDKHAQKCVKMIAFNLGKTPTYI
jgi:hypothetical protein